MRVSVLYNEDAGDSVSPGYIRELVERYGHQLLHVIQNGADPKRLLEDPPELVVAAGGDGTVSAAAQVLAGQRVPLAILPLGTANNIAWSLGSSGPIEQLIGGWDRARPVPLDLGIADGAWGRRRFVEAVGVGLIPAGIAAMQARPGGEDGPPSSKIAQAVRGYREALSRLEPCRLTLSLDGACTTDEFLLLEALNIRSIGPNLRLSIDADPSDGLLSVVMAGEQHREDLARYLHECSEGREGHLSFVSRHARRVEIEGCREIHVDGELLSCPPGKTVSISLEPSAVQVLAWPTIAGQPDATD